MRIRIYQIADASESQNRFMDYDYTMEHGGIDESAYKNVF